MKPKIAVIQYPGSNCEYETAWAVRSAGMEAEIFRWNRSPEELKEFDGYIISGGFSYQDRVRAGAIAAKKPIMKVIKEEAEKGKPVLGICNGAQILVEAGMIPGICWGEVEMALAPNLSGERAGYYCNWIFVRCEVKGERCVFTKNFSPGEVIPLPVAHAEGRFITSKEGLLEELKEREQIVLRYCNSKGEIISEFPVNPNGSVYNIAGICNPEGNVFALMPHPERANWIRQVPSDLDTPYSQLKEEAWGDLERMRAPGPGRKIFTSLLSFFLTKR